MFKPEFYTNRLKEYFDEMELIAQKDVNLAQKLKNEHYEIFRKGKQSFTDCHFSNSPVDGCIMINGKIYDLNGNFQKDADVENDEDDWWKK